MCNDDYLIFKEFGMQFKKLSLLTVLIISQSLVGHYNPYMSHVPKAKDPCRSCPTPCPKPALEELENIPSQAGQRYKRNKEILHEQDSKVILSLDDLQELKEAAKQEGDFETFAEAHHRIKVEVATEDEGQTVVIKLKELGLPVVVTAVVAAAFGAVCTHYFGSQKNK